MSTVTDHAITFCQHVATYLRINAEFRAVPRTNPQRREQLRPARAAAFKVAEQASVALLAAINADAEPGFIQLQARELVKLWDERNRIFNQLTHAHTSQQWDENPSETLRRLDRAEKRLRDHLNAVNTILQKMS